jgi:hypothetical protein
VLDQVARGLGGHDGQVGDARFGHAQLGGEALGGPADRGGRAGGFHPEPDSRIEEPLG